MGAVARDCLIIDAWIRRAVTDEGTVPNEWQVNRVTRDGRAVYSYGRHFPLAEVFHPKGRRPLIVLNGDEWSGWPSRTREHQNAARQAASSLAHVADSVVIPYSALDGAGIDRASIRLLEVRPDRNETFDCVAQVPTELLARPLPSRDDCESHSRGRDPLGQYIGKDDVLARNYVLRWQATSRDTGAMEDHSATGELMRCVAYRSYVYDGGRDENGYPRGLFVEHDPPKVTYWHGGSRELTIGDDGRATFTTDRHWLGDALFTADRVTTFREPCSDHRGTRRDDSVNVWCDACGQLVTSGDPPLVTREKRRHHRFVSSFDYNERTPLYFLCALPRSSRARTVAQAIEDLAPRAVHAAYARGIDVKRQGDVFAIATPLTDSEVYGRATGRARLSVITHGRKPRKGETGYVPPLSPSDVRRIKRERRRLFRKYLAESFARADDRRPVPWRASKRHDLAELRATIERHRERIAAGDDWQGYERYTVANAERGLADAERRYAAKLAESRARRRDVGYGAKASNVWNGADGKALTDGNRARAAWDRATRESFAPFHARRDRASELASRVLAVYGTAHTATEVVTTRDGTYLRGIMRHRPTLADSRDTRDADHRPVKLGDGKTWYLAVRNTVPRQ